MVNFCAYGLNMVNCAFKHEIIKCRGNNCFIPTKGYCFVKCGNFLTGKDYKQKLLDFNRNEERRSSIMTMVRIQPCLLKLSVSLGYYNAKKIWPRNKTEKNIALKLLINHFCSKWKSERVSFIQAIKELKENFRTVDNYITEEKVSSHFENI